MVKVMFVCLGNICRSPMAEFVFKDMVKKAGLENDFYIKSSGENPEIVGVFLLLSDGSIKHVSGTENAQMSAVLSILGSGSSVLENVELPVSDQVYASIQDPNANESELIYPYYLV